MQEHKFDVTKNEHVNLGECVKIGSAFRWTDPRTWLYLWYYHYEIELKWDARLKLKLVYMDTIFRTHETDNNLNVTLVPTFFKTSSNAVEENCCISQNCRTTVIIPEAELVHFSLSIKLVA